MEQLCMGVKNETIIYYNDFYRDNFYNNEDKLNLFKFKELDINYNEIILEKEEKKTKKSIKSNIYKIKKYCKKRNWKYEWLKFDNETIILIVINKQKIIHEFFGMEKEIKNSQEEAAKKALKYFTSIDKKYYFKRKKHLSKKSFLFSKD